MLNIGGNKKWIVIAVILILLVVVCREMYSNTNVISKEGYDKIIKKLKEFKMKTKIQSQRQTKCNIKYNQQKRNDSFLFSNDGFVSDCISKQVIRKKTKAETTPFVMAVIEDQETAKQRQSSFQNIYKKHVWSKPQKSVDSRVANVQGSGPGSTLDASQEAMGILHILINEIKEVYGKETVSLLDIPCGDFVWMSRFLQQRTDIKYTGMDIVPHLIQNHQRAFLTDPNLSFIVQDIAEKPLQQKYDIIFSRMMLQHLSKAAIMKVLYHFSQSGSLYLLTTTATGIALNAKLSLARYRFRPVNMEIPPIQLEPPVCVTRDGPRDNYAGDTFLGLWNLPLKQVKQCRKQMVHPLSFKVNYYFCS